LVTYPGFVVSTGFWKKVKITCYPSGSVIREYIVMLQNTLDYLNKM
jgi:hypothetical protein